MTRIGLSDAEIESRFGPPLEMAIRAFGVDPSYATAMVESANRIEDKARRRAARANPYAEAQRALAARASTPVPKTPEEAFDLRPVELRTSGMTLQALAEQVNSEGYRTAARGSEWSVTTLSKALESAIERMLRGEARRA